MFRRVNNNKFGVIEYAIDSEEDLLDLPREDTNNAVYSILRKDGKNLIYLYSKEIKDYILINGNLEKINVELENINEQLEHIETEVNKPITLNKCDEEMLGAIQNKEGETTFNLLSIPRDGSVTPEKTNFVKSSYQYLNPVDVTTKKYYWLNGENVDLAEHGDYKVFSKLTLKKGKYYFKQVIPVFSFVKNISTNETKKLLDVLVNVGDNHFTVDYDFEFYCTALINDNEIMLSNAELSNDYKVGDYDIVIDDVKIKEIKNNIEVLKQIKGLEKDSIETDFIKDKQVTIEKTDFININVNYQFLLSTNFIDSKYYWHNSSNNTINQADNREYKIYPKLSLKKGVYSYTSFANGLSFIKNIESGVISSVDSVISNGKITVDYDFELYLTYGIDDINSMLTNSSLPSSYIEGEYNKNLSICNYDITNAVDRISSLEWNTNSISERTLALENAINQHSNRVFKCGSGEEYTKLKDVIEEAVKYKNSYVYVKPETFDLATEFGQEYLDNYDGREFGIHLYNDIHLIFDSGAKVIFDYKGNNAKVHEFFAPFNAKYDGGGFELVNAWVESTNCRYSVHDEHAGDDVPYRNIYRHCVFIHDSSQTSWGAHQAIGGGLGKHGDIVVEDCYGKSVGTSQIFSWHNAVKTESCKSNIVVKGCYLEGYMDFCLQGTYTDVTNIFVSNCSLTKKPLVVGDSNSVVNMKIYEWNNEIRQ